MHGLHDETDLKVMGGLWRRMPYTAITFTLGALALSGVPPLAGFFAKDAVLEIAQSNSEWGYLPARHPRGVHLGAGTWAA